MSGKNPVCSLHVSGSRWLPVNAFQCSSSKRFSIVQYCSILFPRQYRRLEYVLIDTERFTLDVRPIAFQKPIPSVFVWLEHLRLCDQLKFDSSCTSQSHETCLSCLKGRMASLDVSELMYDSTLAGKE